MDIKRKYLITVGAASALTFALIAGGSALAANRFVGMRKPTAVGIVASVSGNSITLTGQNGTTYTVDASKATIKKITPPTDGAEPTPTTINISQIQTGDTLLVQGTLSGNNVTATQIVDGVMVKGHAGIKMGQGIGGTVASINGSSLTVAGMNGTSYSVDASSAKVNKFTAGINGNAGTNSVISLSDIKTGDTVRVLGTVTNSSVVASEIIDGTPPFKGGFKKPAAMGTVATVSSTTLTVNGKNGVSYTIDASNATVNKFTPGSAGAKGTMATIPVSQIVVGDTVIVQGTVSGTEITATEVTDGAFPPMAYGRGPGRRMHSQTSN